MPEDANKNTGGNSEAEFSSEALDEALREFDASGGFSGKPKASVPPKPPQPQSPQKPAVTSPAPPQSPAPEKQNSPSPPASTPASTPAQQQNVQQPKKPKPNLENEFPDFDDEDTPPKPKNTPPKAPDPKPNAPANNSESKNPDPKNIDILDDLSDEKPNKPDNGKTDNNKTQAKQQDNHPKSHDIDADFDSIEDDIIEGDLIESTASSGGGSGGNDGGNSGSGGNDGGSRKDLIIKKLKEPKNAIILGIAVLFLVFLLFTGGGKKKVKTSRVSETQDVAQSVANEISEAKKDADMQPAPQDSKSAKLSDISLEDIQLPNLDIQIPDVKPTSVDLIPNIPEPKPPEPKVPDIKTPEVTLPDIPEQKNTAIQTKKPTNPEEEQIDIKSNIRVKDRNPIEDQSELKPLITDFTGGAKIDSAKKSKKDSKDFIFVDTDLDVESEQNVIKATRIQDPENVVAQGRIIDAVLETAINSTIGGQVRAVVTRDVYAETGKNIMIPKGTRLYGEYGNSSTKSADRIIITWTRIMRPDNISATINSFAADQFGRSGIQGQVDNKYFNNITTSILLSTIPLVATIVTNSITNARQNSVTTTGTGGTTIIQDPVNIATQAFTQQIGQATSDIIKNMGDIKPTIILEQGTRVKVLVNQDIKLPEYKPITRTSSGVKT